MEFFNNYKKKQSDLKKDDIKKQAKEKINLMDFEDKIYIAYSANPLEAIEENWTQKEIIARLNQFRENFIKYQNQTQQSKPVLALL